MESELDVLSPSTRSTRASTEYIVEWKVAINIPGRCPDNRLLQGPARPHLQVAGAPQAQSHPRPGHGQVSVSSVAAVSSALYPPHTFTSVICC